MQNINPDHHPRIDLDDDDFQDDDFEPRGREWRPGMQVCIRCTEPDGSQKWHDADVSAVTGLGVILTRQDGQEWPDNGGPMGHELEVDFWVLNDALRDGTAVLLEPDIGYLQKAAVIILTTLRENGFHGGSGAIDAERVSRAGIVNLFEEAPGEGEVYIQVGPAEVDNPRELFRHSATGMMLLREAWQQLRSWETHISGSPAEQVDIIENGLRQFVRAADAIFGLGN